MTEPVLPPPIPRRPGLAGLLDLDPLSPLLAILPPIAAVAGSRTWEVGAVAMCAVLPALVIIQPRRGTGAALGILAFTSTLTLGFASSADGGRASARPLVENLPLFAPVQWDGALDFTARVGAILALVLAAGLLSGPEATIRAFVVHLRMPTRIAEAGIASLGLVDVLRREQRSIIEAQLLRGTALDAPLLGRAIRRLRSAPALVAAAIRHAERVSMSMDARAFGAHPTRTERVDFAWRARDTVFLVVALALTALLVSAYWSDGFTALPQVR